MHTDQMTLADLVRELAATPEVAGAIEASATTFWDILEYGDEAGEIRYSRFLCWLLNPSKDHGLGSVVAQALFAWAGMEAAPLHNVSVRAEWRNVDIVLTADDAVLAIENKTMSREHPAGATERMQTDFYAELLESLPGERRLYLYLTPDGHSPHDEEWTPISYAQLAQVLADIGRTVDDRRVRALIEDFVSATRRRFNLAMEEILDARLPSRRVKDLTDAESTLYEQLGRVIVDRGLAVASDAGSGFKADLLRRDPSEEARNRAAYLHLRDAVQDAVDAGALDRLLTMIWRNAPFVAKQSSDTSSAVQDAVKRLADELKRPDRAAALARLGIPQPAISGYPRQSLYFDIDGAQYFLAGTGQGLFPRKGGASNLCRKGLVSSGLVDQWEGERIMLLADELIGALALVPRADAVASRESEAGS